jgi:hypothetical protein
VNIPIRQTELNRAGFSGDFTRLGYYQRKRVAALTLNAVGRKQEAFLLEINNPNAVSGITYVDDTPSRT